MTKYFNNFKKSEYTLPFFSAVIIGMITHICVFVNKFPNADAMTNFYFDQNMVTSGRWFLMPVCGISSFYDLNWMIGVLSILYLGIASVILVQFWEIKTKAARILIPALLVTFPAVTATAAYLYTMDGYMIALILAILAPYLAKKYKWGFAFGAVSLAFSMGIYQAYLAITVLLCLFAIMELLINREEIKKILMLGLKFLAMGVAGGILYYVILKICLAVQGKELDTYQGLNEIGTFSLGAIPERICKAYYDFAAFALKGKIFANNVFSAVVIIAVVVLAVGLVIFRFIKSGAWKDWYRYFFLGLMLVLIPVGCNIILLMSSDAYYHMLMRMQWTLFPILGMVIYDRYGFRMEQKMIKETKVGNFLFSAGCILVALTAYRFAICDNIAYFNMNERYEKTYAYCLRLLDRMEQTPGYEPGMRVAMIGVVNQEQFPDTDITGDYTSRISGTNGSILIYSSVQYAEFMKHYLNVTFEPVLGDEMIEIYNSKEYQELDSFPGANSMKVVDGILYIKTE